MPAALHNHIAEYVLERPTLARGRLLIVVNALAAAQQEAATLIGYLDGIPYGATEAQYLALGIERIESRLIRAVRALDMEQDL